MDMALYKSIIIIIIIIIITIIIIIIRYWRSNGLREKQKQRF